MPLETLVDFQEMNDGLGFVIAAWSNKNLHAIIFVMPIWHLKPIFSDSAFEL